MIQRASVQEVVDAVRIEDVVSDFLTLHKRGTNYIALCPFHNEKTPSFHVSPSKNMYKCFGCGVGGDAIQFVIEHEKYSFVEAVKYLADKYNINIKETEGAPSEDNNKHLKDNLYSVNDFAQKYFTHNLYNTEIGKSVGLNYLTHRGLKKETIEKFGLGFALPGWDNLKNKALNQGYSEELLIEADIILSNEKGDSTYDKFRERVIFPIHNLSGKTVGFAGRILKDEKTAKYVNSKETPIYIKGNLLYGLFQAKKSIQTLNTCILVEGYMDVLSLVDAGIQNVVSVSGTAFTKNQALAIKRFCSNIMLLFDADEAGVNATLKNLDIALEVGLDVKVVNLPENDDPDSYIKKVGHKVFVQYIEEQANDLIPYKIKLFGDDLNDNAIKKAEAVQHIVDSLQKIEDNIKRELLVKQCSHLMGVSESVIISELNKKIRSNWKVQNRNVVQEEPQVLEKFETQSEEAQKDKIGEAEAEIIRLLLYHANSKVPFFEEEINVGSFIIENTIDIDFHSQIHQDMINIFREAFEKKTVYPSFEYFQSHQNHDIRDFIHAIKARVRSTASDWKKKLDIHVPKETEMLDKVILRQIYILKLFQIPELKKALKQKLKNAKDYKEEQIYLEEILNLEKDIENEIARNLGTITKR